MEIPDKIVEKIRGLSWAINARLHFKNAATRLDNLDDAITQIHADMQAADSRSAKAIQVADSLSAKALQVAELLQSKVTGLEEVLDKERRARNVQLDRGQGRFSFIASAVAEEELLYKPIEGSWLDGAGNSTFTNMELESGRLIANLVSLYRCQRILETGTHCGYSSGLMAQALVNMGIDGHIWTFDPFQVRHVFDDPMLQRYVTWVNDFSFNFQQYSLPPQFDLLVLDSDHTYRTLASEVESFEPLLRIGGLMVFHDSIVFKDLWPVVESVKATGRFEVLTLETPRTWSRSDMNGSGLTICRKTAVGPPISVNEQYFNNDYVDQLIGTLSHYQQRLAERSAFFNTSSSG